MAIPRLKEKEFFRYSDYLLWSESERWELIHGEAFNMSPASGKRHQRISARITRFIDAQLDGKSCHVFAAPFDVRPLAKKYMPNESG